MYHFRMLAIVNIANVSMTAICWLTNDKNFHIHGGNLKKTVDKLQMNRVLQYLNEHEYEIFKLILLHNI